ncbi:MAG: tetratricopeptide repeat protein [Nannocystaceae bacterium]
MATGERSPEDFDDELEASADEAAAHVEPHNDPKFDSADEDDSNVDATELDVSVDAWTHTESDDDDAEEAESVELAIDEEDDGHPAEGHPIERWVEDGGERGDELAVDEEDDDEEHAIERWVDVGDAWGDDDGGAALERVDDDHVAGGAALERRVAGEDGWGDELAGERSYASERDSSGQTLSDLFPAMRSSVVAPVAPAAPRGRPDRRVGARVRLGLIGLMLLGTGSFLLSRAGAHDRRDDAARLSDEPRPAAPAARERSVADRSRDAADAPAAGDAPAPAAAPEPARGEPADDEAADGEAAAGEEALEPVAAAAQPPATPDVADAPAADSKREARALARRGAAALRSGDRTRARALFDEALALDERSIQALAGVSDLLFDAGDYRGAHEYGKRAVRVSPRNADHRLRLGDISVKLGRRDEARAQYEEARRLGHPLAERRLARL